MQIYSGLCRAGLAVIEDIPFHVCRELTVIYIMENDLKVTTVAGTQVLSEGQTEILNVKEPVMLASAGRPCKAAYFSFDRGYTESIDDNFDRITYNCNICNFFGAAAKPEHIQSLTGKMFRLLTDMLQDAETAEVEKKTGSLLSYIRENFDDVGHVFSESAKVDIGKERFKRISEYMIEHVSEKMTLNDIAQNEYLSIPYLSKEFSKKLEKNYHTIINYYRTINAAIQLLDTEDSLTFIAENSGFSSIRYYNRVFSEFLGCLPSKFRSIYRDRPWKCTSETLQAEMIMEEMKKTGEPRQGQIRYCLPVDKEVVSTSFSSCTEGEQEVIFAAEGGECRKIILMEIEDAQYMEVKAEAAKMSLPLRKQIPEIQPKREYVILSEDEQSFKLTLRGPWSAEIYLVRLPRED